MPFCRLEFDYDPEEQGDIKFDNVEVLVEGKQVIEAFGTQVPVTVAQDSITLHLEEAKGDLEEVDFTLHLERPEEVVKVSERGSVAEVKMRLGLEEDGVLILYFSHKGSQRFATVEHLAQDPENHPRRKR